MTNESTSDLLEGQTEYSFLGTDGEFYQISRTPHEFVRLLKKDGVDHKLFNFENFDLWLWLHLKAVPSQKNIKLEDVYKLYFQPDIPSIVDLIFRRLAECSDSSNLAIKVIIDRLTELEVKNNAAKQDGDIQQEREELEGPRENNLGQDRSDF